MPCRAAADLNSLAARFVKGVSFETTAATVTPSSDAHAAAASTTTSSDGTVRAKLTSPEGR
jgi:hypothetical protein